MPLASLGYLPFRNAAVQMFAYGVVDHLVDEHICMGESTCLKAMYSFCRGLVAVIGDR
jgi:hypothetical protein